MAAFAAAIGSGALPHLEVLGLSRNQIGDAGVQCLVAAVGSGALPKLVYLGVAGNPASQASQQAAEDAIKNRSK